MSSPETVTSLLLEMQRGGTGAVTRLMPHLYDELHRLARRQRRPWRDQRTPGTTSLVHEAYLKLVDQEQVDWQSRAQFFCLASRAMRSILVDDARRRGRRKRGGDCRQVDLDAEALVAEERPEDVLALDEALERLAAADRRAVEVVECRFFGGLSVEETAAALSLSTATIKRSWNLARAWLYRELAHPPSASAEP